MPRGMVDHEFRLHPSQHSQTAWPWFAYLTCLNSCHSHTLNICLVGKITPHWVDCEERSGSHDLHLVRAPYLLTCVPYCCAWWVRLCPDTVSTSRSGTTDYSCMHLSQHPESACCSRTIQHGDWKQGFWHQTPQEKPDAITSQLCRPGEIIWGLCDSVLSSDRWG